MQLTRRFDLPFRLSRWEEHAVAVGRVNSKLFRFSGGVFLDAFFFIHFSSLFKLILLLCLSDL